MVKIEDELKVFVEDLYLRIKAGLKPEAPKLELKSEWYNLDKSIGGEDRKINVSKFMKEIGAIANSYGPGSGHIVVGLSEEGEITNSPLSASGINDESELSSLVVKCIDKPIRFEYYQILTNIDGQEKIISIIVVPVSVDKPHVIYEYVTKKGRYENYTPVKHGTSVRPANRSDLDLMYYDKQNIIPEYAVSIKSYKGSAFQVKSAGASISIDTPLIFENYGRKPMILINCELIIIESKDVTLENEIKMKLGAYSTSTSISTTSEIINQPIIIPSNEANAYMCHFYCWDIVHFDKVKTGDLVCYCIAEDAFGNKYESKLFRTKG